MADVTHSICPILSLKLALDSINEVFNPVLFIFRFDFLRLFNQICVFSFDLLEFALVLLVFFLQYFVFEFEVNTSLKTARHRFSKNYKFLLKFLIYVDGNVNRLE